MNLDLSRPVGTRRPGPPCILSRVATDHGEDTAGQVMAAIRDPGWGPRPLAAALAEQGLDGFTNQIISNHRNGGCASCRDAGRYQP